MLIKSADLVIGIANAIGRNRIGSEPDKGVASPRSEITSVPESIAGRPVCELERSTEPRIREASLADSSMPQQVQRGSCSRLRPGRS